MAQLNIASNVARENRGRFVPAFYRNNQSSMLINPPATNKISIATSAELGVACFIPAFYPIGQQGSTH